MANWLLALAPLAPTLLASPLGGGIFSANEPPPEGSSQVTADIMASRTSGAAPLAVFFDATGTTHNDSSINAYHHLVYEWDFGDSGNGNWARGAAANTSDDDQDKNTECCAPIAAHVFEDDSGSPYTVTLTVTDLDGTTATATETITVTSETDQWATTETVCISQTADDTGCPAGATSFTSQTSNFDTEFEDHCDATDTRCLFHDGQTWTTSSTTVNAAGPSMLGKYGAGADPIVTGSGGWLSFNQTATDWRVVDWEYNGDTPTNAGSVAVQFPNVVAADILLLRVALESNDTLISCGTNIKPQNIGSRRFIVESDLGPTWFVNQGNIGFCTYKQSAWLGNTFHDAAPNDSGPEDKHFRTQFNEKTIYAHNDFADIKGQITWRALSISNCEGDGSHCTCNDSGTVAEQSCDPTIGTISTKNVISDNYSDEAFKIEQTNTAADDGHEDYIIERNFIDSAVGTCVQGIFLEGPRRTTVRNNIVRDCSYIVRSKKGSGRSGHNARENPAWNMDDIEIYGNSLYDSGGGTAKVLHNHDGVGVELWNNAVFAGTAIVATESAGIASGPAADTDDDHTPSIAVDLTNEAVTSSPYTSGTPASEDDFCPSGAPLSDAGTNKFLRDFAGNARTTTPDIGAWESDSCP